MKAIPLKNEQMQNAYAIAEKAARVDFPVLINGETGVGKEFIAKYIYEKIPRSEKSKFISLNCSAIPENLIESELFGYVKGAFTGATKDKIGFIKIGDGGVLFLDEIGEMSLYLQNKLLRVLENGEFVPVGSVVVEKSNFRLICATNADLKEKVKRGEFRIDLYHRINVITIKIPPLRERLDEIPYLIQYVLDDLGFPNYKVSLDVMDLLLRYPWPGNIRELRNVTESAFAMMDDHETLIRIHHLPADRFGEDEHFLPGRNGTSLKERERLFRETLIRHAIDMCGNDYKKVMQILKTSKDVIYRALASH